MNFQTRPDAKTSLTVVKNFIPSVLIASKALTKMSIYVKECSEEIGWLGTARKNERENTIIIDDVYLFDQDVHGATTEITPEGLSDFAEELLSMDEEGMEIWNNLKMWGHSHVNMGVTPSGQDDKQMETFREGGHDWFIRLIANKKGEMKIDLYDYRTGVVYLDLAWEELLSDEELEIHNQIDMLYAMIDELEAVRIAKYKEPIKKEMKEKVRKITYGYQKKTQHLPLGETKSQKTGQSGGDTIDRKGYYEMEDIFEKDDDVLDQFSQWELLELSECTRFDELQSDLELYGYHNYFTDNDVERIYRVCRKVQKKFEGLEYGGEM